MSSIQQYANAVVYLDGALATEENQVSVTREYALQHVATVAKGFAGATRGAPTMRVQIRNAVPKSGFEFDPGAKANAMEPVEVTVFVGGKKITQKMLVDSDSLSGGVNSSTEFNFDLIGPWAAFS